MSTRGAIGFEKDGNKKITYNHFDSYPTGLGVQVAEFVRTNDIEDMRFYFDKIKMVKPDSKPSKANIQQYQRFLDMNVSDKTPTDWYCLLRHSQGDLNVYLHGGVTHMIDNHDFLNDSLFCEWAYIVNLDNETLDIYRGFQLDPNDKFKYLPCKKVVTLSFYDIKKLSSIAKIESYMKIIEDTVYKNEDVESVV